MQHQFMIHAEYSVPYADTVQAARQALEADGYTQIRLTVDYSGHHILVATVPQ